MSGAGAGGSPEVRELYELARRLGRWDRGYEAWLRWRSYATLDEAGPEERPHCDEAIDAMWRGAARTED